MKKTLRVAALLAAVVALSSCSTQEGTFTIPSDDPYFPNKTAKETYNAFLSTAITGGLNYLKTQDGSSAQHFANFVDGLLLQNEFGTLEKQLAESITQTNNYTVFTIEVKSGIPWVTNDGTQYTTSISGSSVAQYVSAEDWVTSAKTVLSYSTASELYYLYTNFIEGAMEYYQSTYLDYQIANGGPSWSIYGNNNTLYATMLNTLIEDATGEESNVTADDIDAIRNFERVGVKVVEDPTSTGGGTIQYTLSHSAFYFPTLLTYSPYLPCNSYFLSEVGISQFGNSPTTLLYCGPFMLTTSTSTNVVYTRNPLYWNIDNVHVETVNYIIAGLDQDSSYSRIMFENGEIDGFTIDSNDAEGWEKYITGPDGTGTIEDPYDPNVNSREYDYIDYVYGMHLNLNRTSSSTMGGTSRTSYATSEGGNLTDIQNAERAMSIKEVRELIIASLDLAVFCEQYNANEELQSQYMINTYVPVGFVQDDDGNDYTTSHYYPYYAEQKGITVEEATETLAQGQYENVNVTWDELAELRESALDAITLYNANPNNTDITLPIQLEYYSVWNVSSDQKAYDTAIILEMNRRLNGDSTASSFSKSSAQYFYVIPTADVTSSTYDTVSNNGNFDISTVWGWGPDYGDPMSYLNTFTIKGDWSSIFGYINDDEVTNWYIDDSGNLVSNNLLEEYTELVDAADSEYENINDRYDLFAEAEYMLLEELAIYRPLTMYGQGRQVSVSRASGYHSPSGTYGLANNRLDGLYVLVDTITGAERQTALAAYNELKEAYLARYGTINIYD